MEWVFPIILGGAALFYIAAPLWAGASQQKRAASHEEWHSVEQLEIDRDLGKIDDAEYEELKPKSPPPAPFPSLEALIFGARRQKRLQTSLESEILIARARRSRREEGGGRRE